MTAFPWDEALDETPTRIPDEVAATPDGTDDRDDEWMSRAGESLPDFPHPSTDLPPASTTDPDPGSVDDETPDLPHDRTMYRAGKGWTADRAQADEPVVESAPPVDDDQPEASAAVELSAAAMDSRSVEGILDDLADPKALATTAGNMKDTILDVVRRRADKRQAERVERLATGDGPGTPTSSTDVRREVVGATNDLDVLTALAGAFSAGAAEAKGIAVDLLDELPARAGKPRASMKCADGNGFEIVITRSKAQELSVDRDEVVEILVAHLIAAAQGTDRLDLKTHPSKILAAGIRDGIDAILGLLASPKFKSTALDSLATTLENDDDDSLAVRLRKAYGRKDGRPSIKVERKPIESKGDDK